MNDSDIAELFGVKIQTVRYWKKYGFPHYAIERLSLIKGKHPDWLGFKIGAGKIIVPSGQTVLKSEIEHYHWLFNQATNESKRNSTLEAKMRAYDEMQISANDSCFKSIYELLD